jgi:Flp pilus assembly protein TadG
VAILVALMALALIGVLAFVTDLGMAYANQRRVQNGADAAALAVGHKIAVAAGIGDNCASITTAYNNALTRSYANDAYQRNVAPDASLAAGPAGFKVSCETVGTNPSTVVVRVQGQQASPSFFGGILGRSSVPVTRSASVIVGPLGTVVGLRPFAICEAVADLVRATPGTTFVVPVTQADAGCGTAPGNWAMMDFDGGNNSTGDSATWTATGYPYPVQTDPPLLINGDPGFNVNAIQSEMDTMFAIDDIVLPVYNSVIGTGNNSQFNIVGFISVTPCRYKINSKTGPAIAAVNPGCAALPASPPSDYLQLKYSDYVPIGDVSLTCALGNDLCDDGPRSTELAD